MYKYNILAVCKSVITWHEWRGGLADGPYVAVRCPLNFWTPLSYMRVGRGIPLGKTLTVSIGIYSYNYSYNYSYTWYLCELVISVMLLVCLSSASIGIYSYIYSYNYSYTWYLCELVISHVTCMPFIYTKLPLQLHVVVLLAWIWLPLKSRRL